jgi:hypothetical protein
LARPPKSVGSGSSPRSVTPNRRLDQIAHVFYTPSVPVRWRPSCRRSWKGRGRPEATDKPPLRGRNLSRSSWYRVVDSCAPQRAHDTLLAPFWREHPTFADGIHAAPMNPSPLHLPFLVSLRTLRLATLPLSEGIVPHCFSVAGGRQCQAPRGAIPLPPPPVGYNPTPEVAVRS